MVPYRGAVIGLGWMGMLYDLAGRMGVWHVDDIDRPTPPLDIQRRFAYHQMHLGGQFQPTSYAEALADRDEIELVAGCDRDGKRLAAFGQRYGVEALYTDAYELLEKERPEIVAVATNTKGRAAITCFAAGHGARGIVTEKPMAYTLEEADGMVAACARVGAPLCCGAISANHPSMGQAKKLLQEGAIGELISIETEADRNLSQHQNWSYFVDSPPVWLVGWGDEEARESGSGEYRGSGMMVTEAGLVVHFRKGAPAVRLCGSGGEIHFERSGQWHWFKAVEGGRMEMPWPGPQMTPHHGGAIFGVADVLDCLAGKLAEPKNSGRRVAQALEVEIAFKQSAAQGGVRVDLPLADRSAGLEYDWHR